MAGSGLAILEGAIDRTLVVSQIADIQEFQVKFPKYDIPIEVRGKQMRSLELNAFPEDDTRVRINHLYCISRSAIALS